MNLRQKFTLVFLILGFIFSSVIRMKFNIANGFEFQSLWITWIPSIFDFAFLSANEQALTTTFLGYACFAISGLLMRYQPNFLEEKNKKLIPFLGVTAFALLFELISLAQDLFTNYYGQHLRIGLLLFVFGMMVYYQTVRSSKIIGTIHPK